MYFIVIFISRFDDRASLTYFLKCAFHQSFASKFIDMTLKESCVTTGERRELENDRSATIGHLSEKYLHTLHRMLAICEKSKNSIKLFPSQVILHLLITKWQWCPDETQVLIE